MKAWNGKYRGDGVYVWFVEEYEWRYNLSKRYLCKVCGESTQSNWFDIRIKWELGNSKIIRFWDDRYVGY